MQNLDKILIIFGGFFLFLGIFWLSFGNVLAESKKLEVSFLDVGQGDAVLIETPEGQNILIDGGPNKKVVQGLSEELSFFDRIIDLMILTHPHEDHVNGLIDVLGRYEVKKILYTGVEGDSRSYEVWRKMIYDMNIPLIIVDKPQTINFGKNCFLDILYPSESFLGRIVENLNNTSIVSRLNCDGRKFLFTGDAEEEIENFILEQGIDVDADIMKAGHHGSDTANTEIFLEAVSPESVVIQVGEENKFGHPSGRILKRLERLGIDIFRNDVDGTLSFVY